MNPGVYSTAQVHCGAVCKADTVLLNQQQHQSIPVQAGNFITKLFDTSDWPPRWHCGTWSDFHGWLYILSDVVIWAAYFLIPVLLIRMVTHRKDLPFPKIIWLFIAFIILCGTTHLVDAIIFWWPAYRLSALIRCLTGIVSLSTVYALYRILPLILSIRTVKDLEHEINERRLVEDKLAASEFLLSEAGRVARVGGWELDRHTRRLTWSNTLYDIFELPYDTDLKNIDVPSYFKNGYRDQLLAASEKAVKENQRWDIELLLTTHNHNNIWVRTIGEAVLDHDGNVYKLRGVVIDVDRYKQNELALNHSLSLQAQQNQQLKNFTHILSHNIRNHASNISLLCSFIEEPIADENNADIFSKMKRVSEALNNTLEDLSSALKIREGGVESELLSFAGITNQVLNVMGMDLQTNNAIVTTSFGVAEVNFPGIYLESIIMNLISNSIKYRKPDVPPQIKLSTYAENGKTVFTCADNGIGIDLSLHKDKVFGLYKTFHKHKDAHGIGLFLIKNQIESQGGSIEVSSAPDKGTTFKITFNE